MAALALSISDHIALRLSSDHLNMPVYNSFSGGRGAPHPGGHGGTSSKRLTWL